MKSVHFLAYAALAVAGVDGKPCSRKPSSVVSAAYATATTSIENSYGASSSSSSAISSSESVSATSISYISSTVSASTTSSSLSASASTVTVSESTSSFVSQSTVSSTESASISSTSSAITSSSSTSSAAQPTQTFNAADYTWVNAILLVHNIHRQNHTAPDLTWSTDLAGMAGQLVQECVYQHDSTIGGGGHGQIIAAGYTGDQMTRMLNNVYYSGLENYPQPYGNDVPDLSDFSLWGNFAQMLWSSTTEVGCAVMNCAGGLQNAPGVPPYFTACFYSPQGNIMGQFSENKVTAS
ncbi:CAP domain-containing protein [Hypoxylon crocopeplum]|nr:CAP domain-containing protein [Hypoxylon crocopeplum]